MKKVCKVLILAVTLLVTACGASKPDYVEIFNNAAKKTVETKAIDMEVSMELPELSSFVNEDLPFRNIKMHLMVENLDDKNGVQGFYGIDLGAMQINMYLKDGYAYSELFGMKIKSDVEDQQSSILEASDMFSVVQKIDSTIIKEFEITSENDLITYSISSGDASAFSDLSSILENGTFGDMVDASSGELKSMRVTYVINNKSGYITDITVEAEVEEKATKESGTLLLSIKFNQLGDTVKIEYPDFDQYQEVPSFED